MSEEEKQEWQGRADQDRDRYERELRAWSMAGYAALADADHRHVLTSLLAGGTVTIAHSPVAATGPIRGQASRGGGPGTSARAVRLRLA